MQAPSPLGHAKVAIIGAGMGGLTCALALAKNGFTDIHVYEAASNLGFVGAGIQLAPNMARILDRLGVWADIEKEAVVLRDTSIRDGASDAELAHVNLDYIHGTYGYYHMVGHRSSLAGSLYNGCRRLPGIHFHFATTISEVRSFDCRPCFVATPRDGSKAPYEVTCDILLGCDGVKSGVRDQMMAAVNVSDARVVDTGQAAYRIMLPRHAMASDPELLELIENDRVTRWIAEKRHIIAYPVSNKQVYNLSTVQPDVNFAAAPSATYTTKGSKTAMLDVFGDFCPKVQKMLRLVPEGEVCEWKLRVHSPLPTWVHGCTALVGDACHPTLPHLAQGAAQAIEDAEVIAACLAKLYDMATSTMNPLADPTLINRALKVYETIRKPRAENLVAMAASSGRALHLGEGQAKIDRDRAFAALKQQQQQQQQGVGRTDVVADTNTESDSNTRILPIRIPDKWADAEVQKEIYGFDCVKIVQDRWDELFVLPLSSPAR